MQNIPMFTTENGVASLTLQEIPYSKKAYVTIQDASNPKDFLKECIDFCFAVGAEALFATGNAFLEEFPLHTIIYEMKCENSGMPTTDACLFPVQEVTLECWREIYNSRMQGVPNSAYLTSRDAMKYIRDGGAYFVHRNDQLLGIGIVKGNIIENVVSVVRGAGQDVLLALMSALPEDTVSLIVAEDNRKAVALYERLGFIKSREISRWYKIPKDVK